MCIWQRVTAWRRLLASWQRHQEGQALVLAAISFIVVMGFTAMAIDIGLFLREKRHLQNAADAAALAGVQALPNEPANAVALAQQWAQQNGIGQENRSVQSVTIDEGNTRIAVTVVHQDAPFWFARVLGLTSTDIRATATAQVGSPVGMKGLMPWGIVEQEFIDCVADSRPCVMKWDSNNVYNGNFSPLRVDPDDHGASDYQNNIINGSDTMLCAQGQSNPPSGCRTQVNTETGNMVGPTRKGVRWRIDNTNTECSTFEGVTTGPPDTNGNYRLEDNCNPWLADSGDCSTIGSCRIVVVPVIESLCNGTCEVTIVGFGLFFLEDVERCTGNDCEIMGRFLKASVDPRALMGTFNPNDSIRLFRLVN